MISVFLTRAELYELNKNINKNEKRVKKNKYRDSLLYILTIEFRGLYVTIM